MITCESCGGETPQGTFCIRCGAPLHGHDGRSRGRSHFAAAPHEHVAVPMLVSSLFPHLPRSSHTGFRFALLGGSLLLVVLAAARLFPLGLIAAAVTLPLLVVLYLIDVDVYEEEPVWAMTLTIAWGAASGIAFGLIAQSVTPSISSLVAHGDSQFLLYQGLVLPFCSVLVTLGGPLILLRYHRFNSVLDGVTFGAASAATFAGAQLLTYSFKTLGQGLRPAGAVVPWIWRLLSYGVGVPLLMMGAAAAACAAIWLRHRAPARDAEALGLVGHELVALPLAALLVVGGAVGAAFLPAGAWLAWLAAFDLAGIVLLRRAIHVGLLEESLEVPIGPEFTCPNCGATTAHHTFCGNCGISLQALPKTRARPEPPVQPVLSAPPQGAP